MGWFGGGSNEEVPQEKGFSDGMGGAADFGGGGDNMYAAGSGGGGGMSDIQQFGLALQQSILIQQVITDLSQKAFEKCCSSSTRDSSLTGKEVACISAATNKWLDANEFLAGRLQMKQEKAAGSGQHFS